MVAVFWQARLASGYRASTVSTGEASEEAPKMPDQSFGTGPAVPQL